MTDIATLPDLVVNTDQNLVGRIAELEAFASQISGAIDQLVGTVLDLHQARATDATSAALQTLKVKLQGLEQQLWLERATRDLERVSRMYAKQRIVVFVGTTYFGCNVKYAYLAAMRSEAELGFEVWFLPYHTEQERLVSGLGGRCLPASHVAWTSDHLSTVLSAAVLVTSDHLLNPNPYAAALLAGARQVQLWHGVSIKEIGLRNLPDGRALGPHLGRVLATCGTFALMLGTAAAGEAEWRRWFAFERYAPIGYPRNDVLYREPTEADLTGCDRDTYERACSALARGGRVILFAPTFRDGHPEWVLEAGLERIAQTVAERGDLLVVNLHPVESPQLPSLQPRLPGVVFVQPRTDLYPLLRKASALVTDYSSVMFDYLHLDRPILFFRPDHAAYTQRSRRLFDHKLSVLPGPLFEDAATLARALRRVDLAQTDAHNSTRAALRAQWFDHADGDAAGRLLAVLQAELALAGLARPPRSGIGSTACLPSATAGVRA